MIPIAMHQWRNHDLTNFNSSFFNYGFWSRVCSLWQEEPLEQLTQYQKTRTWCIAWIWKRKPTPSQYSNFLLHWPFAPYSKWDKERLPDFQGVGRNFSTQSIRVGGPARNHPAEPPEQASMQRSVRIVCMSVVAIPVCWMHLLCTIWEFSGPAL